MLYYYFHCAVAFYGKVLRTKAPTTLPDSKYGRKKIKEWKNEAAEGINRTGQTRQTLLQIAMHVQLMGHGVFNSDDYATFTQGK